MDDLLEISTRTDVVNADVDSTSTVPCDLSVLGTVSCSIQYEIEVKSYNSTFTLASGDVIFVSECLSLNTLYQSAVNSELWAWPSANKAVFDKGYALRQTEVSFLLP